MNRYPKIVATASMAAALCATSAQAADWSDTSVGIRYGSDFREPFDPHHVSKAILNFTHVSGDKLGTNFLLTDVLMSDHNDPAKGGAGGAQEIYAIYQRTFSLSALSGRNVDLGFAKDISLDGRVDLGAKNSDMATRPRKLRLGLSAALPVSVGFLNVAVYAYHEWNYNGIVNAQVHFKTAPAFAMSWAFPIGPGSFEGFIDFVGQMGKDGFGAQTKTMVLARPTYLIPIGGAKSGLKAGIGYEYWKNKYSSDSSSDPTGGSTQSTALALVEYHF